MFDKAHIMLFFHSALIISDGRARDHADVLHALSEEGRLDDSTGDSESDPMERLRDGQVKLCAARYGRWQ
jgi:hypothetical protein